MWLCVCWVCMCHICADTVFVNSFLLISIDAAWGRDEYWIWISYISINTQATQSADHSEWEDTNRFVTQFTCYVSESSKIYIGFQINGAKFTQRAILGFDTYSCQYNMSITFPDIGNSIFLYSALPIYVNVNECLTSVKWVFYIGKSFWVNPEWSAIVRICQHG